MIGELTWNRNIRYTSVKSNRTSRIRTWNSFQNERFSLWSQVQTPHMTLIINGSIKTHTVRMRLRMQDRTVLALRLRLSIEILCLSDSVSSPDSEYGFKNSRMHLNPHPLYMTKEIASTAWFTVWTLHPACNPFWSIKSAWFDFEKCSCES